MLIACYAYSFFIVAILVSRLSVCLSLCEFHIPYDECKCYKSCLVSIAAPLTLTEIITIAIVAALVVVAVIFAATTCAVRSHSYSKLEGRQPLLGEQYQRYDDDKGQSVV